MTTTIAVKSETMDLLRHIKDELKAETFDETIMKLVLNMKKPRKSMFGSLKGFKKEFLREEIDRFS
ncbi:hypothetical protein HYY72_00085 [Candidatus Woesearchaeota archaeon]|nr:hypothetical protein [Candidatus Woesearchaeota archaeon]